MTLGLVNAGHSLPEGQAVKLTFFALCGTLSLLTSTNGHLFMMATLFCPGGHSYLNLSTTAMATNPRPQLPVLK